MICRSFAPYTVAVSSHVLFTPLTPATVFSRIGKNAPMKMMKTIK